MFANDVKNINFVANRKINSDLAPWVEINSDLTPRVEINSDLNPRVEWCLCLFVITCSFQQKLVMYLDVDSYKVPCCLRLIAVICVSLDTQQLFGLMSKHMNHLCLHWICLQENNCLVLDSAHRDV